MSLYLPIKQVFKNDRLPQKLCDKCSCKVNDFYQFCNETIEVQDRLRAVLVSSGVASEDIVDLTRVKENASPVPSHCTLDKSTQTEWNTQDYPNDNTAIQPSASSNVFNNIQIKVEPRTVSPVKEESTDTADFGGFSDNSDDMSLITLKKKKRSKKEVNGVKKKAQKKKKLKDWESIVNGLPDGTHLSVVNDAMKADVKVEMEQKPELDVTVDVKAVKDEPAEVDVFHCCICFLQCYSKAEILQHYR
ncbi:Grauzone [Operophtera brumata]|uniref:Grauzone n=1 Tax=Operophtera brumata TaxID=104452 RepID=A0A0L7LQJ8_OPEBR|nr:Grauzone [Operophtera brumata]